MRIIITGGASGLGEAITRKIAHDDPDHELFITYNHSESEALRLKSEFKNISVYQCNCCNETEVEEFISRIPEINPDVLINNCYAGSFLAKHFHKTATEDYQTSFTNNILPVIGITRESMLCFRRKKFGKIINISSAALVGNPITGASVYMANKSYIESLSRCWAAENAGLNITSNCIAPSMMNTALTAGIDERIKETIQAKHPLKELLAVEDVANSVLFLLNSSQHINGIVLTMNAGTEIK